MRAMMNTVDLNTIDDVNKLKALVYDQMLIRNTAVRNIEVIEARITNIINSSAKVTAADSQQAETSDDPVADGE